MSSNQNWFCPYCGTKNDNTFCSKCGKPKPNKINNNIIYAKYDKPIHDNKTSKYIMIAIIIVLVIILSGILFYMNKDSSSDNAVQTTSSQSLQTEENTSSSKNENLKDTTSEQINQVNAQANNANTNNTATDNKIDKVVITRDSLIGNWKRSDGSILSIDNSNFGMATYTISQFNTTEDGAQIKISLNGGRSVSVITFSNNNASRFTIKNLSTGTSETYIRQ